MKAQQKPGWCAPASLQNALRLLGKQVGQARLAKLMGTTEEDGTDEQGIIRAVLALGYQVDPWGSTSDKMAFTLLDANIGKRPHILCIDKWQHWVVCAAKTGERYIVIDSSNEPYAKSENQVLVMAPRALRKRWRAGRRVAKSEGGAQFYAIGVDR